MNALVQSKVQLAGIQAHECGYCKSKRDSSISFAFISPQILATDYEQLMLAGWRRSGTYFYKPIQHRTCCPPYTIRLKVADFQPSKSQKKVLRRSQRNLEKATRVLNQSNMTTLPATTSTPSSTAIPAELDRKEYEEKANDIVIEMEKALFTDEKYELYKKYQIAVHLDKEEDLTPKAFTRFLIESSLVDDRNASDRSSSAGLAYGTYHQLYRVASTKALIAVGVIDILPTGVSGVYCFYDVDYRDLALGKYAALKEIEFCQKNNFQYYYMGFYIHSCVKMRYKGEYKPSELLCTKTLQWFPLADCIPSLEEVKFTPFASPYKETRRDLFLRFKQQQAQTIERQENQSVAKISDPIVPNEVKNELEDEKTLEPFLHVDSPLLSVNEIALELGKEYPPFKLNRLTKQSQDILTPILQEWIQYAGNDIARRFVVLLH